MATPIKKPRAGRAPDLSNTERIDNLLRKMQMGLGYDPLVELVKLAKKPNTTNAEKIKIAQDLMSYVYPKVKAVSNDPNMGDIINIVAFTRALKVSGVVSFFLIKERILSIFTK